MCDKLLDTLDAAIQASPFIRFCQIRITKLDEAKGSLEMVMPPRAEFMRGEEGDGMFHGGPVAALIDTAGDFAVAASVGGVVPTVNFRVDYFRPAVGELKAVATTRRLGRAVCIADVDVYGADGKLCAVGRGTYSGKAG